MKQTDRDKAAFRCQTRQLTEGETSHPTKQQTAQLTQQQMSEIAQLTALCQEHDHSHSSYPFEEDGAIHFLLYRRQTIDSGSEEMMLCCALALLPYDSEEPAAECIAFTRPDCRRQGYFTELLDLALDAFEDFDILFPVLVQVPDTLATLQALEAELDSQELQMELSLEQISEPSESPFVLRRQDRSGDSGCSGETDDTGEDICTWVLMKPGCPDSGTSTRTSFRSVPVNSEDTSDGTFLGSCQTTPVSRSCVCLHHVEILPQYRRQGCGTALLEQLAAALKHSGVRRVILQVSGDNEAALALYKKQGFRITETLSYYLY
ncbi:MAG: GNAT family N-acetyltransferase [Eubacteriales bacterium]|nr:GNAT family N-acetyltransferase [Eubacteriales bacterium]